MHIDHLSMLHSVSELNNLFSGTVNIDSMLQKIVEMISSYMKAEACSIYFFEENTQELILKAKTGLNGDMINSVRLPIGEGLIGLALKEMRPINEKLGKNSPGFRLISGHSEERLESFLAVPVIIGVIKIGVIVVQRADARGFTQQDVMTIQTASAQLASMIENARFIIALSDNSSKLKSKESDLEKIKFVKGKVASEGFAYAGAIVVHKKIDYEKIACTEAACLYTLDDFMAALDETERQINDLKKSVESKLDDAASMIFSAHQLMLRDESFVGGVREMIEAGSNVPSALIAVFSKYKIIFSQSSNPLIREKVHDIEDLVIRILDNLVSNKDDTGKYSGAIVITRELYPSDLLKMSAEKIGGIILVRGGVTSHVSILARSLGIPVVIVDSEEFLSITPDVKILLDAEMGNVYLNPGQDVIQKFHERNSGREKLLSMKGFLQKKAETVDGVKIKVMANVNLISDLKMVGDSIVDGVGLYRSEFPFLIRSDFPSEEEQYNVYRKLVDGMPGKPIYFRTLDIGGDKILSYYNDIVEQNPFLGMRSIRFSLTHKNIFMQQVRAILRAGHDSDIGIMFPMIASVDDFIEARDIVYHCIHSLSIEGIPHNNSPQIGAMIEVPSAVTVVNELAETLDFMSIGTNDLIQYTLAVDRTNEKVAHLFLPHHPSILRSLSAITEAGRRNKIDVSVCGDMASSRKYIPFLIGIGIRILSVDSMYIPKVKKTISEISVSEAEQTARDMLAASRIGDIERILNEIIQY